MFNIVTKSLKIGDSVLSLETGLLAKESDVAVVAKYGNNTILCTLNISKEEKENDFFPLTVNYVEKYYAAGKIPKGYYKREGRMTQREILTSRVIDRAIRPCFDEDFMQETGVMCTLMSYDGKTETDIPAALGVAAALKISGAPLKELTVSSRVGFVEGEYVLNPNNQQLANSSMDMVMACTKDCVVMLEGDFNELPKDVVLGGLRFGLEKSKEIIDFVEGFAKEVGIKAFAYKKKDYSKILAEIKAKFFNGLQGVVLLDITNKAERKKAIDVYKAEILKSFEEKITAGEFSKNDLIKCISKIEEEIVRAKILNDKTRLDGRGLQEIRTIDIRNNILPVVHGSSLFTRGRTQVLSIATLGGESDEQQADSLTDPNASERFSLHYNFNPYSCGEASSPRAPGRREIGHGRLAYKGLKNLIPSKEQFPYSIRTVSEVTGSDGSTSMATLCSSCLALISTGVPLKNYVAGIAMGLIKEKGEFLVLTDIMAEEDYLGDMDFKIISTDKGMTAVQMDLKVSGISPEVMDAAFDEALVANGKILFKMKNSVENLSLQNLSLSPNAPQFAKFKIEDKEIPVIIGKGGSTIKEISKNFGVKINIGKDGSVEIFEDGVSSRVNEAKAHIELMLKEDGEKKESRGFDSRRGGGARDRDFGDREPRREPRGGFERPARERSEVKQRVEIDEEFFSNTAASPKSANSGDRYDSRPVSQDRYPRGDSRDTSKREGGRGSRFEERSGGFNKKYKKDFSRDKKKVGLFSKFINKIKGR